MFAQLRKLTHDPHFINTHKVNPEDFTRNRSLSFPIIIAFLINFLKSSLQCELDNFFACLSGSCALIRKVSKSAFSQARLKLKPSAFVALNQSLVQFTYQHCAPRRWRGFRVIAGDSSSLRLPHSPALAKQFGLNAADTNHPYVLAKAFGLLDVANSLVIHAQLSMHASCERSVLLNCLEQLDHNDLLVLDRGFPAFWLFTALLERQQAFCARVDNNGFAFVKSFLRSRKHDKLITMAPSHDAIKRCRELNLPIAPIQLRLIRFTRPNGQQLVLATSLLDQRTFPAQAFDDLYHQRWAIEEWFKILKCRLWVEQFSGLSPLAIEQDFYAKIFAANLCACLTQHAQQQVRTYQHTQYRVNFSYALSACKNVLPRLLFNRFSQQKLLALIDLMACTLEQVRPGRSYPRHHKPVKPTHHRNYCGPR